MLKVLACLLLTSSLNAATATPTATPSPTATFTPCGQNYFEDFSSYTVGSSITANPPNYVTAGTGTFTVASDLGNQAARIVTGGQANALYNGASYSGGYLDLKLKVDAASSPVTNVWFHSDALDAGTGSVKSGYVVQIKSGQNQILFYKITVGNPSFFGFLTALPSDYSNFTLEIIDNAGLVQIYVNGVLGIQETQLDYVSGHIGFGGATGTMSFSQIYVNQGSCLPTNTPSFTLTPTPTPPFIPTLCAAPFPKVFTQVLTPIIVPTYTLEQSAVGEFSCFPNKAADGYYYGVYGAGWTAEYAFGIKSQDGINWTKFGPNPVIGNGFGGEAVTASRNSVIYNSANASTPYSDYFADQYGNIVLDESADAVTYTRHGIAIYNYALSGYGIFKFDSTGFAYIAATDTWYALVDTEPETGAQFQMWFFSSTDHGNTFQPVAGPLNSMYPPGVSGVDFGSPRAVYYDAKKKLWHAWFLVGVPSNIFESVTPDWYNWFTYTPNTIQYTVHLLGLTNCNQAADPGFLFDKQGNRLLLYFDATDNSNSAGREGVAIYPGDFTQFGQCNASPPGIKQKFRLTLNTNLH